MDLFSMANAYIQINYPRIHNTGENFYNKGGELLAPVSKRVNLVWGKFSPKISENLFLQAFYLGHAIEQEKWSYYKKAEEASSNSETPSTTTELKKNFGVGTVLKDILFEKFKKSFPPEMDANEAEKLWNQVKADFLGEKTHDHAPLNAMCMEIFWGFSQVFPKLKQKADVDQQSVDESVTHFERAAIHLGRAYHRRSQHLFHNMGFAIRWTCLWYALGKLHPWGRKAGFYTGLGTAFIYNTKDLPQMWQGAAFTPNLVGASARVMANRSPHFLHSVTAVAFGLVLWHKSGIPQISPLASAIMTFLLSSGAGHYVGSPIESVVKPQETKPAEEKTG